MIWNFVKAHLCRNKMSLAVPLPKDPDVLKMRSPNPIRRNRNIGTSKSGHGQNNRMTIPEVAHGSHAFWERIETAQEVSRKVSGRRVRFFVQSTRVDCIHACTVDDIAHLISLVPLSDWEGIHAIVLRQPHRKEETLASAWGRLSYSAELVNSQGKVVYAGPAITLEAVNPSRPLKFGKSLSVDSASELNRLVSDGHQLRRDRHHTLDLSLESCRATQLYRTIPHELGHWVDFLEKVERPSVADESVDYASLLDRYHGRATREKESFAHAYAERLRTHLLATSAIPFPRRFQPEQLQKDGLSPDDFAPS